jgi:3-oxoacyl-[acyl-carrier protein] reductase
LKTLVVTGASRGIGRHVAEQAATNGFRVIGLSRSAAEVPGVEMRSCDVADANAVKAVLSDLRRDENLYGLINAAGVLATSLTVTGSAETAHRIITTNLFGTIHCCQTLGKMLMRRGIGRIINFSSVAVTLSIKGEGNYVASKAGVEGFSRTFARELGGYGVTVNVVAPGPIETGMIASVPPAMIAQLVAQQFIPRQATVEDIWALVQFLLSPQSAMISGEVIHVGGCG